MSGGLLHGFSKAVYERTDDGHVLVTMPDGRSGLFDKYGKWTSGELYDCDPEMCLWVGGGRSATSHRLSRQA